MINPRSQTPLILADAISLALYLFAVIPFLAVLGGVDNDIFKHAVKVNFAFGGNAVDASVLSPFQSMAGLAQPLAVRLHLPYALAYLVDPSHMNAVVTMVCAFLMSVAIFVFSISLGAHPITAVIARQIAAVGFFPPLWAFLLPWAIFRTTK